MTGPFDPSLGQFEAGLADGIIRALRCRACGLDQSLDPLACRRCSSTDLVWTDTLGRGVVYAATQVHRAPTPALRDLVPYTLLLVDLDGGSRVMAHGTDGLGIGERASAHVFHHGGNAFVRFVREEES